MAVPVIAAGSPFSASDKTAVKQRSVKMCSIAVLENVLDRCARKCA